MALGGGCLSFHRDGDGPVTESPESSVSISPINAENFPALRVLVVDDEFLIRWSIAETLESAGCSVLQAETGRDALRILTDASLPIDAVVLDYRLPDSNDLTLLSHIRELAPQRPVILMSAYGSTDMVQGARALGAYEVLNKPFDLQHLHALIREACAQ
jgi:DNA-binding NtrC family response regulator